MEKIEIMRIPLRLQKDSLMTLFNQVAQGLTTLIQQQKISFDPF